MFLRYSREKGAPSPFPASALWEAILTVEVQTDSVTPPPDLSERVMSSPRHHVFPFLSGNGLTMRGMS